MSASFNLRGMHHALADPLRVHVLELLVDRPRSASELAPLVEMPANRLYHHLAQLEKASLIKIVEYRPLKGGKVERVYAPATAEPPGDDSTPAERARFLAAMVEATQVDITLASRAQERGERRMIALQRTVVRLSELHLAELRSTLERFVNVAREHPDADGVWTTVLWTTVDRQDRGATKDQNADGL